LFSIIDRNIYEGRVRPSHGPGSNADGKRGNAKWYHSEWTDRLERVFPYGEYAVASYREDSYHPDRVRLLRPGAEIPVKVIAVPKTQKTPRIIAMEPSYMMFMQQGIWRQIRDETKRDNLLNSFIRYEEQELNQTLARKGSIDGSLATLDLKEASDRVSYQLVKILLNHHPHLREAVDATRSRSADVLGHGVIRLAKFASMGSALCFPFESLVFLTCIFMGIEQDAGVPLTRAAIKRYAGRVSAYGDDLIVPRANAASVVRVLETFGLRVNSGKSFWNGNFRESCGKEYFKGYDVTIVRVREDFPTRRQDVKQIVSLVSSRNQFFRKGYFRTCEVLDRFIERFIPFPVVGEQSPVLGRHDGGYETHRWDTELQRPLVKGVVVKSKLPKSYLDGEWALLKCLLNEGDPLDVDHLERSGRAMVVELNHGWHSAI